MPFRKYLIPTMIASLGGITSAQAQSSLQIYGVVDMAVGSLHDSHVDGPSGAKRVTKVDGNQMVTSYIGFKGSEDLGGGLKAGFTIESFLRPDTGESGRFGPAGKDPFWSRAANVWLQGRLGKVTAGRQGSLLFGNTLSYNPLGAGFGLSPIIRLTFGSPWGNDKSDSGWSNAVTYSTPNLSGFTASVQAQAGEDATKGERSSYAVSAGYSAGPFSVGGAWQNVRSAEAPKLNLVKGQAQSFGMLGLSYDAGFAKFFGQYGAFANKGYTLAQNLDTTLFQIGASVPVTKSGKLLASFAQSKEEAANGGAALDVKHRIVTVAYDHWLSKRTDVYGAVMVDDEKLPGYKKGYSYVAGVRHAF